MNLNSDIVTAKQLSNQRKRLRSGLYDLDNFLEGGLRFGDICEFGIPWGQGGRNIIMPFLAAGTHQQLWALWVQNKPNIKINAPAWKSRGINLAHIRFVKSSYPLEQLKPIFMEDFFKIIILDAPKMTKDDCAFLARQARQQNQLIFILRDYFLSQKNGNIWAKLRINCWRDPNFNQLNTQIIRGLSPRKISINLEDLSSPI
tara:strand:- start:980 stop:1585 length:606 start_codon:yes stop_codon:yes gene_type:complete